jgi:hypothetical protein
MKKYHLAIPVFESMQVVFWVWIDTDVELRRALIAIIFFSNSKRSIKMFIGCVYVVTSVCRGAKQKTEVILCLSPIQIRAQE